MARLLLSFVFFSARFGKITPPPMDFTVGYAVNSHVHNKLYLWSVPVRILDGKPRICDHPGYFSWHDLATCYTRSIETLLRFYSIHFALIMIAYALLGHHIPGDYGHPEFSFHRIIERLYTSGEGFSGLVVYIISTMVAIFIIMGAVLSSTQMGQVLIDLAKIASGRLRGGAALMAVISSALFGTISGSGPANVVTIGTFTIPMMKRLKYKPEFAAAVESVASTGGQIMPPIMGAGAFIMAEMLGKSYLSICVAAALPAILYFLGAGMGIYFEALRINLPPTPKEEIPKFREVLRWSRIGPIISFVFVLLYLMARGYTPQYSCFWAFMIFIGLFIFTTGKKGLTNILTRARMIFHGIIES